MSSFEIDRFYTPVLTEARFVPILPLTTVFKVNDNNDFPFLDLVRSSMNYHLAPRGGEVSRKQLRSALEIVGEPENLSRVVRTILDTPEELKQMQALEHYLGFTRFTLVHGENFKLKLHLYDSVDKNTEEGIHDHRFDKAASRIIKGVLSHEVLVPTHVNDPNARIFYKYYQYSDSDSVYPVEEDALKPRFPENPTLFLPEGTIYTLQGDTFHRIPVNPGTCTLFLHTIDEKNEGNHATIFSNNPNVIEDDTYPSIPLDKAVGILDKFLNTINN